MRVMEAITKLHEAVDAYARLGEGMDDPITGIDPNEQDLSWHVADFILALGSAELRDELETDEYGFGTEEAVAMMAAAMFDAREASRE